MSLLSILSTLQLRDLADIILLTVLLYHLYLWFRGTKAFKALVGMMVIGMVFTVARTFGLFLTTWVFQILWQVLVILLIILFQSEIREVLERVNPRRLLGFGRKNSSNDWTEGLCNGIFNLASRRMGALVILERTESVDEWISSGQDLEAEAGTEMLLTIFQKDSSIHDGAVIVKEGRIRKVACYLPLSSADSLPKHWGTRHRAALGLSERCDALVLVVSEERGTVSAALDKTMREVETPTALIRFIQEAFLPVGSRGLTWRERIAGYFTFNRGAKLASLFLVSITWLLLAGQQDFEVAFNVSPTFRNIPQDKEVAEPFTSKVNLVLRGLRRDASTLREADVRVEIDLSMARVGQSVFPIGRDQVALPNDRLEIVQIRPPQLEVKLRDKR